MCYNIVTVKDRRKTKMKNSSYKKGTYHVGYAYITKKTAHKKVRANNKKASKED